jgi:hypothetical protein
VEIVEGVSGAVGTQLALFPAERELPDYAEGYGVQVRLEAMQLTL